MFNIVSFLKIFTMSSPNKILVSIGDSVLRDKDVQLLKGPYWLNDCVISFYFEYLEKKLFKHRNDILFVSPEVTHCLKAAKNIEIPIFLDPLNAKEKKYVLFALNDHRKFEQSGGTHWSLLIYGAEEKCMYHLDSVSPTNFQQASRIAMKLVEYFLPKAIGDFRELEYLQQDNAYDCGIFVLAYAEYLMTQTENGFSIENCPTMPKTAVNGKRENILRIVEELSKEQNRS